MSTSNSNKTLQAGLDKAEGMFAIGELHAAGGIMVRIDTTVVHAFEGGEDLVGLVLYDGDGEGVTLAMPAEVFLAARLDWRGTATITAPGLTLELVPQGRLDRPTPEPLPGIAA